MGELINMQISGLKLSIAWYGARSPVSGGTNFLISYIAGDASSVCDGFPIKSYTPLTFNLVLTL